MIQIANAPVSVGVFELAEPGAGPDADAVLETFAAQGYQGIDLGPVGFLGVGAELDARLERHGLGLAGGWIDLPFFDDAAFAAALPDYRETLGLFAAVRQPPGRHAPKPTLACSGTPDRAARPGGGSEVRLDAAGWASMIANVERAAGLARELGLEPTFHHHACTYVETVDEIDELLAGTSIGLTFDTGHLILGGGDPVGDLDRWAGRVNHVHLKDARLAVLRSVVATGGGLREVWESDAFVPLGAGDLDLDAVVGALLDRGYDGWIVVEQDALPRPGKDSASMFEHQRANREALRRWFP